MPCKNFQQYIVCKTNFNFHNIPLSTIAFILIFGSNFIESRNQLVEGLPIDDQTRGAFWRITNDIRSPEVVTEKFRKLI